MTPPLPIPAGAERRYLHAPEFRVAAEGETRKLTGYAAMFNAASDDLGGFTEIIAPGAFRDAIPRSDIRALFNHDPNFVLGRMRSGTLAVQEDSAGLAMEATPPDVQWVRDLIASMERGDIDQMSFAFRVAKNGDEWVITDEQVTRTITKVEELYDVSVVTYPAYPDTSVAVRSRDAWRETQTGVVVPDTVGRDLRRRRLQLERSR